MGVRGDHRGVRGHWQTQKGTFMSGEHGREPALTAHVAASEGSDVARLRQALVVGLDAKFDIDHVTLQIEAPTGCREAGVPNGRMHA